MLAKRLRRRASTVTAALLLLGLAGLALAAQASAHAQLIGSNPSDGTTVQTSPAQLRIDVTQSVFPDKTSLTIADSNGRVIPVRNLTVLATGSRPGDPGVIPRAGSSGVPTTITADLPTLPPDIYRVTWKTLSTDDLHATSGVFVFGVQRAVAHQAGQVADPLPPLGELASRVALLLSAAVAVGAGAVLVLLRRLATPPAVQRRLLLVGTTASTVAALSGLLLFAVQAEVLTAGLGFARDVLSSPAFLLRWAGREGAAVLAAVTFGLAWRRSAAAGTAGTSGTPVAPGQAPGRAAAAGLPLLALFAATSALLGHAGSGNRGLDVAVHALHVGAALVWVGTVVTAAVVLAPRSAWRDLSADADLRRAVLGRFGLVGLTCLTTVLASGLVLTGAGTASLDALLLSTYGRLVLLKVLALVVAAASAGLMTVALHPRSVPARWRGGALARPRPAVLALEGVVLVAALALGGTAAGARPALGTEWTPTSQAPPLLSQEFEDLVETVKVGPNVPGRNFVTVNVFDKRRPSPGPVTGVDVTVRRPGGTAPPTALTPQGEGTWLVATDAFDEPGSWTVTVVAHRDGLPDTSYDYAWLVADPSARLAAPIVSSADDSGVLDALAVGVAGGGAVVLLVLVLRGRRRRAPGSGAGQGRGGSQVSGGGGHEGPPSTDDGRKVKQTQPSAN